MYYLHIIYIIYVIQVSSVLTLQDVPNERIVQWSEDWTETLNRSTACVDLWSRNSWLIHFGIYLHTFTITYPF